MLARSIVLGLCIFAFTGCSSTLETGYKPRRLGDTDTTRRSYYASPYTPESRAAKQERESELEERRPRPGY